MGPTLLSFRHVRTTKKVYGTQRKVLKKGECVPITNDQVITWAGISPVSLLFTNMESTEGSCKTVFLQKEISGGFHVSGQEGTKLFYWSV